MNDIVNSSVLYFNLFADDKQVYIWKIQIYHIFIKLLILSLCILESIYYRNIDLLSIAFYQFTKSRQQKCIFSANFNWFHLFFKYHVNRFNNLQKSSAASISTIVSNIQF